MRDRGRGKKSRKGEGRVKKRKEGGRRREWWKRGGKGKKEEEGAIGEKEGGRKK